MNTSNQLTTLLAILALGACAGSDNQAETANTEAPSANTEAPTETSAAEEEAPDSKAGCVAVFARQRDCTDEFIPALVDARIRLDRPAGIAARASSEGRDALIAEALAEWAKDSQDAAIDLSCEKIVASVPAEALESMVEATGACLQESECGAFTTCVLPVIEGQLQ